MYLREVLNFFSYFLTHEGFLHYDHINEKHAILKKIRTYNKYMSDHSHIKKLYSCFFKLTRGFMLAC
jgi:hypothetical protein